MTTEEILTKAAKRKCPECEDDCIVKHRCKWCDKTGLWLPELSEKCPCAWQQEWSSDVLDLTQCLACWSRKEHGIWCKCDGTDTHIYLNDRDRLDAAAERLGCTYGDWAKDTEEYTFWYGSDVTTMCKAGGGDTILEAQQAALASVIKHVWPEVEND